MADKLAIVASDMGRRMLSMISPIYDRSHVGLWMMEVIGREMDALRGVVESAVQQITPRRASWSLPFWAEEYGLEPDVGESDAALQARIIARMQSYGAFTPYKIKAMAAAGTGAIARVAEIDAHHFAVYLSLKTSKDARFVRDLTRAKPAHLHCEVAYEAAAEGALYTAGMIARGLKIEIRQVN